MTRLRQLGREEWQHDQGIVRAENTLEFRAEGVALSRLGRKVMDAAWEKAKQTRVLPASKHGQVQHCLLDEQVVRECALWALSYLTGNVREERERYKVAAFIGARCEYIAFLRDPKVRDSWHLSDVAAHNMLDLGMAATLKLLTRKQSLGQKWDWTPLVQVERTALGVFYLENAVEETGWYAFRVATVLNRTRTYMYPSDGYRQYLRDYAEVARRVARPLHAPMVCKPEPFDPEAGAEALWHKPGYLSLRCATSSVPLEIFPDHIRKAKPYVWAALNRIQESAFTIDEHVLDVVRKVWDHGIAVGSLPKRDPMDKPQHKGLDRVYEREMFAYKADHRQDVERSRCISFINAAGDLVGQEIYFPAHLDHRGRVYTRGSHVNYLAADYIRQSLDFARTAPVGHHADILASEICRASGGNLEAAAMAAIGRDPLGHLDLWQKAKEPWRLMKLCKVFADLQDDRSLTSGCPFPLDQSTSGYGHLAMLTRDAALAKMSNCIGTSGSSKSDIYCKIRDLAREENSSAVHFISDPKELQCALWCRDHWPSRSVFKRVVMPAIYGQSFMSVRDVFHEYVTSMTDRQVIMDGVRVSDIALYLARLVYAVIKSNLHSVANLTGWLRSVGKEMLKLGAPAHWYAPNGLKIQSWSGVRSQERMRLVISGRTVKVEPVVSDNGKYKLKPTAGRQVGADFIHSYDAAFLHYAVSSWTGGDLAVAHDSFATTIDKRDALKRHLNDQWARFYETDYLTQLYGYATMLTGADLPAPPIKGNLDMAQVGHGQHLFT